MICRFTVSSLRAYAKRLSGGACSLRCYASSLNHRIELTIFLAGRGEHINKMTLKSIFYVILLISLVKSHVKRGIMTSSLDIGWSDSSWSILLSICLWGDVELGLQVYKAVGSLIVPSSTTFSDSNGKSRLSHLSGCPCMAMYLKANF